MNPIRHLSAPAFLALVALPSTLLGQRPPGHPIGDVEVLGNLIHLELDEGAVVPARPFDLDRRTLRFTPSGPGYAVENVASVWDDDFGDELEGGSLALTGFAFPFSGREWREVGVGNASLTFGIPQPEGGRGGGGGRFGRRGGFAMERYPELQTVGRTFLDVASGIAVFVRPATLRGERYVKELSDRAVITWTLTEPTGGIQAFSWTPTVNRMQAVLHRSGVIELSYDEVSVGDGVVGVFPTVDAGVRTTLGAVPDAEDAGVEANLDLRSVTLSAVDDLFLEATLETRGPVLPEGDPGLDGVTYRIALEPGANPRADVEDASVVWTVRGVTRGWGGAGPRYLVSGSGAEPTVTVEGTALTVRGILPRELAGARQLSVSADAAAGEPSSVVDRVDPRPVTLDGLRSPEIDLSASKGGDPALPVAYEGFHWNGIPRAQDVACSVITALGDHFDFLASYSDFRVDNPEGGTPSTGPRGGNVSGIGSETSDLEAFCSDGRLQFMYFLPVSTSAVQFDERSPDGRMTDYDYAMSQIGHELGHRWAANADALVDGERISLGQTHWAAGVHLPAAFPYSRPYEADAMGGSTWQENPDGTFTQLDRDYYSPAKGFSWFALYLMGLARPDEVEPFFILRNLERTGEEDAEGRPVYTGDKTVITIDDVVAAMGPREPDVENAQKEFNTGVVILTLPGEEPTQRLIDGANDIAEHWIRYWTTITGGRAVMTTEPG